MNKLTILIITLILGIFVSSVSAQEQAEARYSKGRMIEISSITSFSETDGCTQKRYVGNVIAIQKSGTEIMNFTLRYARSSIKISLSPSLYKERLTPKDAKNLGTLISRGRKLTADTYTCSASRPTILASYIFAGSQPNTLGQAF